MSMVKNNYKIAVLSILVLTIIIAIFIRPYRISGDCMEPAVMDGQLCLLNSIPGFLQRYQINDIIAFKFEDRMWISRIVALENSAIQITEGNLVVNNISDQNISRNWLNWNYGNYAVNQPFYVPSGHVFVLSDNLSAQHDDSRVFGPIPMTSIFGTVWCCK